MDHLDETYRSKQSSLMKAYYAMKNVENESMPCHIEEGLFLGSYGAASNMVGLKSLNVTHVLVVANSLAPAHPNDFVYKRIDGVRNNTSYYDTMIVADRVDTNLAQYFDECFEFIEEAKRTGGAVLVHCYAGISRSVTIVLAYLMKKHHLSLSEALEHVKSKRPKASPNLGFLLQLRKLENSLRELQSQARTDADTDLMHVAGNGGRI